MVLLGEDHKPLSSRSLLRGVTSRWVRGHGGGSCHLRVPWDYRAEEGRAMGTFWGWCVSVWGKQWDGLGCWLKELLGQKSPGTANLEMLEENVSPILAGSTELM